MHAAGFIRQHMRQEQALIDLKAVFVLLRKRILSGQQFIIGKKARQRRRGVTHQIFDALEFRQIAGDAAINRLRISAEKFPARRAVALEDRGGGGGLRLGP